MTLDSLDDYPEYSLPPGFSIEPLGERDFYEIHKRVGATRQIDKDIVANQYAGNRGALTDHCLLLRKENEIVGVGVAWWNPKLFNERWGVVDWLSIDTPYQAKGLSRPFLSAILKRLSDDFRQCYADTQADNFAAIRLALSFGFKPRYGSSKSRDLWHGVKKELNHSGLTKQLESDELT